MIDAMGYLIVITGLALLVAWHVAVSARQLISRVAEGTPRPWRLAVRLLGGVVVLILQLLSAAIGWMYGPTTADAWANHQYRWTLVPLAVGCFVFFGSYRGRTRGAADRRVKHQAVLASLRQHPVQTALGFLAGLFVLLPLPLQSVVPAGIRAALGWVWLGGLVLELFIGLYWVRRVFRHEVAPQSELALFWPPALWGWVYGNMAVIFVIAAAALARPMP